jgi:8-oxo-dGTP pyrophosphatase MutT (NUDIX family)
VPEPPPSEPPPEASWVRDGDAETLEENWLFQLRRERFRSRVSGRAHGFYVLHLADVVNVIAVTPERQVVMVRQFRAGSRHDSLETPGGLLEPGEDPAEAGARELLEETGYAGDPPRVLGAVWSNPSILTSRSTTLVIANARLVAPPALDPTEELTVELVPADAVTPMIRDGRIDHSLVVAGLLWWLALG